MGCVESSKVIVVKSMNSFKKFIKDNNEENEDIRDKIFRFSDFYFEDTENSRMFSNDQSDILLNGRIENNELILM